MTLGDRSTNQDQISIYCRDINSTPGDRSERQKEKEEVNVDLLESEVLHGRSAEAGERHCTGAVPNRLARVGIK